MGTTEDTEKALKDTEWIIEEDCEFGDDYLVAGEVTGVIRQAAYDVHRYFGPGFLEKVYENALANRLKRRGFGIRQQVPLDVCDEDGTVVGSYCPDLLVEHQVIVEVKTVDSLAPAHRAQILNYLKVTGLRVGLLLNFNSTFLQVNRAVL